MAIQQVFAYCTLTMPNRLYGKKKTFLDGTFNKNFKRGFHGNVPKSKKIKLK